MVNILINVIISMPMSNYAEHHVDDDLSEIIVKAGTTFTTLSSILNLRRYLLKLTKNAWMPDFVYKNDLSKYL